MSSHPIAIPTHPCPLPIPIPIPIPTHAISILPHPFLSCRIPIHPHPHLHLKPSHPTLTLHLSSALTLRRLCPEQKPLSKYPNPLPGIYGPTFPPGRGPTLYPTGMLGWEVSPKPPARLFPFLSHKAGRRLVIWARAERRWQTGGCLRAESERPLRIHAGRKPKVYPYGSHNPGWKSFAAS